MIGGVLLVGPLTPAHAQRVGSAVGARRAAPPALTTEAGRAAAARLLPPGRAERAVRNALIGAAAGAATGAVVAFVALAASDHADRSEDGMAYLILVPAGTVLGFIVGGIHGAAAGS